MSEMSLYMAPDSIYFVEPGTPMVSEERFLVDHQVLPDGWTCHREAGHPWTTVHGPRLLPPQGWKLHVAARPADANEVLALVSAICFAHEVSYKYLRTPGMLRALNRKYSPRSSSAKFITLYPADTTSFDRIAKDVCAELAGRIAPTVLTDVRLGQAPVYGRFGAFREKWMGLPSGEDALALYGPSGGLIPDIRRLIFDVPREVDVPDTVQRAVQERQIQREDRRIPYRVERALHFSNAGGVYEAWSEDGTRVVLKEGRRHTGTGLDGRDAADGLQSEADALRALDGIPGVPHVLDWHSFDDRDFLVEEHLDGVRSIEFVAREHPDMHAQQGPADYRRYAERVRRIVDGLDGIIDAIHARGWSFGDLHPGNMLIGDDDRVSLVDFETASADLSPTGSRFAVAPGFRVDGLGAQLADRRRIELVHLWMLIPESAFWEFSDAILARCLEDAMRRFSLPTETFAGLKLSLRPEEPSPHWHRTIVVPIEPSVVGTARRAEIDMLRFITRESLGDAASPVPIGAGGVPWGVDQGAAGVLWALRDVSDDRVQKLADWVQANALASPRVLPGLYVGDAGVALVLASLDREPEAQRLLDRALDRVVHVTHPGLRAGLSGVAWAALCLGALDDAVELAERAIDSARAGSAGRGLLDGSSGVCVVAERLYGRTGDVAWLDAAEEMVELDLRHLVYRGDGSVLLDLGNGKHQPDLGHGSLGVAVAAGELLRRRNHDEVRRLRAAAGRTCLAGSWATQGLFDGRSGAVAYLASLEERTAEEDRLLEANTTELLRRFVEIDGSLHFPGRLHLRFSHDLASGMSGALHTLRLVSDPSHGPIPLLEHAGAVFPPVITHHEKELHR